MAIGIIHKVKKILKKPLTNGDKKSIIIYVANAMNASLAQLGEHLPYKQRVIGSSPIVPTNMQIVLKAYPFNIFVCTVRPGSSAG